MLIDKELQELLHKYLMEDMSGEEKIQLFNKIQAHPAKDSVIEFILHNANPSSAEKFLSDKELFCDTSLISAEDETLMESYFTGMMEPDEEKEFFNKLSSNNDLCTNVLAQAVLFKTIQKILEEDNKAIEAAKETTAADVKTLFTEFQEEDDDELIYSYMSDELSDEEKINFENRLKTDNEFNNHVIAATLLSKGIQEEQEKSQKAIHDAKCTSKEDVIATLKSLEEGERMPASDTSYHKTRLFFINGGMRKVAAAIIVFLIVGVGYNYYNYKQVQNIAREKMTSMILDFNSIGASKMEEEEVRNDIEHLFETVKPGPDLKNTISKLEKYYKTACDDNTDIEDDYVDQISYALATAYVYNKQISKAKEVLKHIINDKESSPVIKNKAKVLLKSINKTYIF